MAWASSHPGLAASEAQQLRTQIAQYEQLLAAYAEVEADGKLGTTEQAAAEQAYATYASLVSRLDALNGS
jgi:hypothetical protein